MNDKEHCLTVAGVFLCAVWEQDWDALAKWVTEEERLALKASPDGGSERLARMRGSLVQVLGGGEIGETALQAISLGFLRSASGDEAPLFDGVPDGVPVNTPYRRVGSRVPIGTDHRGNPAYVELEVTLKQEGYDWRVVLSEVEGYVQVFLPIH